MDELRILILAAGKGTRMRSDKAKVLHTVCGVPMIRHVLDATAMVASHGIYMVVGEGKEAVQQALVSRDVTFIHQERQLGTGHAVMAAAPILRSATGSLLILYGDMPMISGALLGQLVETHQQSAAAATVLTAHLQNPFGYGRIIRAAGGEIERIVEERDATSAERSITEVNTGIYSFNIPSLFEALDRMTNRNAQNEYYLTDVISVFRAGGQKVAGMIAPDPEQVIGINTRYDLSFVESRLRRAILKRLMEDGATIIDPQATYIDADVVIGADTIIYPNTILEGNTIVGAHCVIYGSSHLVNAQLADHVTVRESTVITDSSVGPYTTVGPYAHVREATQVGARCRVGNFVEIKKSILGDETKAAHMAYIGDAELGNQVNIGAGTITCNYDGTRKNKTIIEDGVFIGSDCQLIAPVRIGKGAYVAAGSTITEDVPPYALGIARGRQVNKENWARQKKNDRQN